MTIHRLELPDLRKGYVDLVDHVYTHGTLTSPRGQDTLEIEDFTFTVLDLTNCLPVGVGRGTNPNVAALEAAQLIAGSSRPDLMVATSPAFTAFLEPDGSFWGAYGNRIKAQYFHVLRKLRSDSDSRQAVVTLWNPTWDNEKGKRDYPCTVALGFRLRKDKLNLSVVMRSNDVWLGVAYDVFQFTQLQHSLAHELDVEVGTYSHTAWSMHLYDRDWPRLEKLHPPLKSDDRPRPRGLPLGVAFELVEAIDLDKINELYDRVRSRWYLERFQEIHRLSEELKARDA